MGTDEAGLTVGGGDLSPDGLVVDASLGVLGSVDVGDALAVVESAALTVLATLDGDQSSVLFLGSLASLESHEDSLGVKSAANEKLGQTRSGTLHAKLAYLTGSEVFFLDCLSMSTFNLIFM